VSRDSTILAGRRFNESLQTSACTITRKGDKVLNETTGEYEYEFATIYSGQCKIKFGATEAHTVDAQGQILTEQTAILSLPVDEPGSVDVTTDDVAELTVNPLDPALVGKTFRVTGLHTQTAATARRFPVEVVS
jgi:hypothetical protein